MAVRIGDLAKATKVVTFVYEGEEVTIEYRLNAMTPAQSELIGRVTEMFGKPITLRQETQVTNELIDTLCWLVVNWDVLNEKGKPLPINRDWLNRLPSAFLYTLFGEILADLRPNAASAEMQSAI